MKTKNPTKKVLTKTLLRDLIDKVNWEELQLKGRSASLEDDQVKVHFTVKTISAYKKDGVIPDDINSDLVRFCFGKDVTKQLGWETGDYIYIANDPNDPMIFLFFKTDKGKGFKLVKDEGVNHTKIQFAWRNNYMPVAKSDAKIVKYEIYKNKLVLDASDTL